MEVRRVLFRSQKYIDEEPYSYAAWYNLGNAFNKLGRFEKAIDAYDYAILVRDNFAAAYCNKGNALMNLERFQEAIHVFRQTFEYEQRGAEISCNIEMERDHVGSPVTTAQDRCSLLD